jgi:hypothetical protein
VQGLSCGGKIKVRWGLAPAYQFQVIVHELSHELLHPRKMRFPRLAKVIETEAEAVAYIVCHAVGLTTGTSSSDYIQLHNGDSNTLRSSLGRIQRTARAVLRELESEASSWRV